MFNKYTFLLLFFALCLSACVDENIGLDGAVVQLNAPPSITSPSNGGSYVLVEEEGENFFDTFSWTAADFGFPAGIAYTLEVDVGGNNFAGAVALGATNTLSLADITNGKLNNILLTKGLLGEEPSAVDFRIVARVSDEIEPLISAPITLTITPYTVIIVFPQLQVPGDYQGWDPANPNTVIFSVKSDGVYEGFNYFNQDGALYKFTDGPSWDVNWGDEEPDGNLDAGGIGNDISIETAAGVYLLHCDLNKFTHFNQKTDWGVLGTATAGGMEEDIDMEIDVDNNVLTLTTDLTEGTLKFRANDDWVINLGDAGNRKLTQDGGDIMVTEAGNYTILLQILNVAEYKYELIKN